MQTPMGYEFQTTFVEDFMIADVFGLDAIRDTFNRAFSEWKHNYIYLTELVIALNWGCNMWYERNPDYSELYYELYCKADEYATTHLKGKELQFFYEVTD